jgi:hypothetical protein
MAVSPRWPRPVRTLRTLAHAVEQDKVAGRRREQRRTCFPTRPRVGDELFGGIEDTVPQGDSLRGLGLHGG